MTDIAIIGPGAIGCAFAAAALQAGNGVSIAGRGALPQVRPQLRVDYPSGQVRGDVRWLSSPDTTAPQPLVLLATKAHQTASAAAWLHALCDRDTTLVILQNGVEHDERIRALWSPSSQDLPHLVPAMVACPSERHAPGHAQVTGPARLDVPDSEASRMFRDVMAGSFAEVRVVDDWLTSAWTKLIVNAAGGGIGVLTRKNNRVLSDEDLGALFLLLAREIVSVGRAAGAQFNDDLPERLLANITRNVGHHAPSIVVDRLAGVATEWQARNEVVQRKAAQFGIDVPYNRMLTALIRAGEPD